MRRFSKTILAFSAIAVTAMAMSGCVFIESQSSAQLDAIGSVQITTRAGGDGDGRDVQMLLAYRLPSQSAAPQSIGTIATSGAPGFTFAVSPSFTAELNAKDPAPAGQQWSGYISPSLTTPNGHATYTVAPHFTLLRGDDGSAFRGPFGYRTVVGFREVDGTHPASRPVLCGTPITAASSDSTACATDPGDVNTLATNLEQTTQDLGILDARGVQSVNQGQVARVKYQLDYAGDGNPAPTFDLSATTDIPRTSAITSTPVVTPGDGITQMRAIAKVPIDTPPGTYDVTLFATLPGGETRTSTHEILVTPTTVRCDATAPTIAGTRGDDVLVGTSGRDVIAGYAGDDQIVGLAGNDIICAGRGDDLLRGGGGNDQLAGRRGNDLLTGGRGHNVIDPGPGKDRMIQ